MEPSRFEAGNPGGPRLDWAGAAMRTNHTPANIVKAAKGSGAMAPVLRRNQRIYKFFN
jgi:hypothetical protein